MKMKMLTLMMMISLLVVHFIRQSTFGYFLFLSAVVSTLNEKNLTMFIASCFFIVLY